MVTRGRAEPLQERGAAALGPGCQRHGEPKCVTGPGASLQPPSQSLLSCAGVAVAQELGSSLAAAAVSGAELHAPAVSALLAFRSTDPFRTMAVGQGIDLF